MGKSIIVVGGGIVGVCNALSLQRAGHSVTLIDRNQISFKGELNDKAESYELSSDNGMTCFEDVFEDRRGFFNSCSDWFNCNDDIDPTTLEITCQGAAHCDSKASTST